MAKPSLELQENSPNQRLGFWLDLQDIHILVNCSFIQFIKQQYNGNIREGDITRIYRDTDATGYICLQFGNLEDYGNAAAYCRSVIAEDGKLSTRAQKSVMNFDPRNKDGQKILDKIRRSDPM